jgi:hypothetical protein
VQNQVGVEDKVSAMAIEPNIESALNAQRGDLLNKLSNSAQASEQQRARQAVGEISDQAQNSRDLNTNTMPVDPSRGRNLNISV